MGKNCLRYFGSVLWNNLPYEIRNFEDLSVFTGEIKKMETDSCKCRICKAYVSGVGFIYMNHLANNLIFCNL